MAPTSSHAGAQIPEGCGRVADLGDRGRLVSRELRRGLGDEPRLTPGGDVIQADEANPGILAEDVLLRHFETSRHGLSDLVDGSSHLSFAEQSVGIDLCRVAGRLIASAL